MPFTLLENLLPNTLSDADKSRAKKALSKTRIAIGREIDWPSIFHALQWPQDTALICDNNTWKAAGKTIGELLSSAGYKVTLLNIGSDPKPSDSTLQYLLEQSQSCAALIAVGSGVINDITQMAAHQSGKPYAICGTAASMNGYLSANAALIIKGHKKSLPATLPAAAIFDLNILEAAPARLTQAGIGDSICRSTAQVDWLLSHHLLGTPYDALPFALLAPFEDRMMAGDMQALISTLLLSGLGMTLARGSYPASQGEHLLSHYLEMRFPETAHRWLHGEQIAVTTVYTAELQEKLLQNNPALRPAFSQEEIMAHFGEETGKEVWQEYRAKQDAIGNREAFKRSLNTHWPKISAELREVHLPVATVKAALTRAGAPTTFDELGLSQNEWGEITRFAPLIRNRFTCLDFV